ncbi:hypothetical protein H206_01720 [Candidatus Electrothrix aarhusensis]|jgi:hypothetical protein|uniref:Cytochrome c domain-containing protein n=1 Tax=Candidatus Electrothrix aarhusensis TaxID=1859131 RepID=A0A3S3RP53_9BACT|nr:hypothetical protein H206_01720 [Candidatus Electrothrix aarhusensis]
MRIRKAAVLFSSLSLLLSLAACKQPDNEKPEAHEPVVSVAVPDVKESEAAAPQENILIDDSDAAEKTVEITDKDFGCIRDMQPVRGMYVGNLLGNIDATIAVANSEEGGVYPPGTVVQIVPGEAMVKREAGFNLTTDDWEFFVLDVSAEGTKIATRGGEDVKNSFGQDCLSCHAQAEPKWDMVCETGHGCTPIPITRDMIVALQKTDKRCVPMELADVDKQALEDLRKLIEGFKAQAASASAVAVPAVPETLEEAIEAMEDAAEMVLPAPEAETAAPVEEEEGAE